MLLNCDIEGVDAVTKNLYGVIFHQIGEMAVRAAFLVESAAPGPNARLP
jgi:hypothetical protein